MRKTITTEDKDYLKNFNEAIAFTKELSLPIPEIRQNQSIYYDKVLLSDYILYELYTNSKFQLENVAQKCFFISKQLQDFFKIRCNIHSVITSGCLFENGFQIYGEEKQKIKERLDSNEIGPPVKFHTWLTLDNYDVVDITYPATIWFDMKIHNCEVNDSDFKKLVWYHPFSDSTENLCYKPLFIGNEYFERVKIAYRLGYLIK
jgi:hypothetical protein